MTIKEFIEGSLMVQIESIGAEFPYHAFALDAIAIEFLGKIISGNRSLDQNGNSKIDFSNAIKKLFPAKYHPFSSFLYEELRCGMLHFFGPKSSVVLGRKDEISEKFHLDTSPKGKLILVFEEFHKDFKKAATKVVKSKKPILQEEFLKKIQY